jgi:protein ImuA
MRAAGASAPLTEIVPAAPGDEAAALGFALAWAQAACQEGLLLWAAPDSSLAETGALHGEGLAQFGLELDRFLIVRADTQADALWAAEQALTLSGACVLCAIAPAKTALSLTATRRLLLNAEKNGSRCVLLRLDALGASAAWTRWRIAGAPARSEGREIGRPSFTAYLARNRAGPTGASWRLEWNAHEHAFYTLAPSAMDGAVAAAPADRSADADRRRAV